jgi:hypothetical protein
MPFLGLDLYENATGQGLAERIPPVVAWMRAQGSPQTVGIGELGCTDKAFPALTSVECLHNDYSWAKANTDQIGIISYFNSVANSIEAADWRLTEAGSLSDAKMVEFRTWLNDPIALKVHPG